jgi:hypothetical protein
VELSLQNATDSLLVNNYLGNTQSSYSFAASDRGYARCQTNR